MVMDVNYFTPLPRYVGRKKAKRRGRREGRTRQIKTTSQRHDSVWYFPHCVFWSGLYILLENVRTIVLKLKVGKYNNIILILILIVIHHLYNNSMCIFIFV
jgi:hypothetical protein